MDLSELAERYDETLRVPDYADVDASANGLQIGPDEQSVETVAFAVDAAVETVERAAEAGADAMVVHHGLSWGGIERVTGQKYRRIAPFVENDVALYVAHLPLDGHQELGNAAGVADVLDLTDREPFGAVGGEPIGQQGVLPEATSLDTLATLLAAELDTGGGSVRVVDEGPDHVEDVAIVTGSGADYLGAAADAGVDLLVTGEGKGKLYHEAREAGVNAVLGGHYATETFGVRSLQAMAEDWGLDTAFIDCPTGL
ncbi:MAG: Nif3-like dinuclear metal center hexameric protein [Halobacteriaceae archaeon]